MLNSVAYQSLLLAVLCFPSWASPLGSAIPPAGECCDKWLDDGAVWAQTQSVDELQNTSPPASGEPSVDHILVFVNASAGKNVLPLATSPTTDLERVNPFNTENTKTSNQTSEIKKGKSDLKQPGHEHNTEQTTTSTAPTRTPPQEEARRLEPDSITRTPVVLTPSTAGSFSLLASTSGPTPSQRSLTITSRDSLSGFSGFELQDNTPVSGFRQSDQTPSSRSVDVSEVWTGGGHMQKAEVSVDPSSQELDAEVTMSSEDLPLIFEPFEEASPPRSSALVSELPVIMVPTAVTVEDVELEQLASIDRDHISSHVPLSGMLDWSSSWQTSESKKTSSVTISDMQIKGPVAESDQAAKHHGKTQNDDITQTSVTHLTVTGSQLPTSKPTDTEDLESKEKPDEDEDEEGLDSDEEEEESEEYLTETTMAATNRPPHSLIPPPPVWVQRNQGLVRSWVELVREKAGYVSGMLAPVGIGIAGALLLVGALYSIRVIHRRRREKFKHERRRPTREVWTGPDNAMLLADSSEDEF